MKTMLFNPYTGAPRHPDDIKSDPQGLLIAEPGEPIMAAEMSTFTPGVKTPSEPSPTAGMNMAQRILHVGGRNNAAGYVEFGSVQAVQVLVLQFLRDMASATKSLDVPAVLEQIASEPPINGNSIAQARILMKAAELRAKATPTPQAKSTCAIEAKRPQLRDALAQALGSTYVCGRVWSAWQHGTMTADDFTPAAECDELLDELAAAVESIKE